MSDTGSEHRSGRGNQGSSEVSQAVVYAIADAEGVSPVQIHPPLATAIDTDALDRLVANMSSDPDAPDGMVRFSYNGYTVTVTEPGDVSVTRISQAT